MKFVLNKLVSLLCIYVSIVLLLFVPIYLVGNGQVSVSSVVKNLLHPSSIYSFDLYGRKTAVIPQLLDSFLYSMSLLAISFISAILLATLLNYLFELSSKKVRKVIRILLDVVQSVPDVMLVVLLQIGVIYIFQATGILVADVLAYGYERVYLLPMICLTVVPTIYLFRMMVHETDKERTEPYVEFAIARGFSKTHILFRHIYPNIIIHLLNYSRSIFLFMLSNLMVVEILFNINGYMNFLLKHFSIELCLIWLFLLVTPFFVINAILLLVASKWSGGELVD